MLVPFSFRFENRSLFRSLLALASIACTLTACAASPEGRDESRKAYQGLRAASHASVGFVYSRYYARELDLLPVPTMRESANARRASGTMLVPTVMLTCHHCVHYQDQDGSVKDMSGKNLVIRFHDGAILERKVKELRHVFKLNDEGVPVYDLALVSFTDPVPARYAPSEQWGPHVLAEGPPLPLEEGTTVDGYANSLEAPRLVSCAYSASQFVSAELKLLARHTLAPSRITSSMISLEAYDEVLDFRVQEFGRLIDAEQVDDSSGGNVEAIYDPLHNFWLAGDLWPSGLSNTPSSLANGTILRGDSGGGVRRKGAFQKLAGVMMARMTVPTADDDGASISSNDHVYGMQIARVDAGSEGGQWVIENMDQMLGITPTASKLSPATK